MHGEEEGKRWLKRYINDYGYAFVIEKPFLFKDPVTREELKEKYGVHVEGIVHLSLRTRRPWVRELLEDLMSRDFEYI